MFLVSNLLVFSDFHDHMPLNHIVPSLTLLIRMFMLIIIGLGVTQAIATTLVALSLFILASDKWSLKVQAVGLACYGVGRLCVFGMFFANVGKRFGYKYYGTLGGSGLMLSAIVSFAQYPLISLAVDGKESIVNNVCAAIVLLLGVPYCFWLGLRERLGN